VDLAKIGWAPPPNESNRSFFKDIGIGKLMALDRKTQVFFLNDELAVVYHTIQQGKNWRTDSRVTEAFFIRVKDGSLVATLQWPTLPRRSDDDLRDSEARLIPLGDGRFVVFASRTIKLYGENLTLVKEKKLEGWGADDMWSVQSAERAAAIFVRHESSHPLQVMYEWLDSNSFVAKTSSPGYQDRHFPLQIGITAGDSHLFRPCPSGICGIDKQQHLEIFCDHPLCQELEDFHVLSSGRMCIQARTGLAVADTDHQVRWSRSLEPGDDPKQFEFLGLTCSDSGRTLVVGASGWKKGVFDGIKLRSVPTLLVYDTASSKGAFVLPFRPASWDWMWTVSPSGKNVAVFDGAKLLIYDLPLTRPEVPEARPHALFLGRIDTAKTTGD
jgi:hypothetical protein